MKLVTLTVAALLSILSASAATPSQSIEQFCLDRSDSRFVKKLVKDDTNLMAFRNQGGIANGGVCWWHSRFQRNALYLTIYQPLELRPSQKEAEVIIDKIRSGKEIVVIPGFRNFSQFSAIFAGEILRELEKWQKGDGVLKFSWVNGLSGKNVVEADKLKSMMDELYEYVEVEGNIAYQKLQIKGITAHAWLVVNMKKIGNGYDLEVLDSNYPKFTTVYKYREGQTHFQHPYYGEFTPYLEKESEMDQVTLSILKECNPEQYEMKKADSRKKRKNQNELES